MEITRRSFLAGLGSVTVGLLFARKLDAVLESLERDLVAEQQTPDQLPSAAEIVVQPQMGISPRATRCPDRDRGIVRDRGHQDRARVAVRR